ncbi:MAG: hypothetical protein AVDCRST_MAG10-1640 [uncultured Acidimicrobiales bacterium]|uniref:Uncharacterized protein n=1 Tax=uncultured Acidimicrobiales bacterium TaxID=310071 RepID=A0A6J4I3T2_9ACTN|nr:MAG: hypothetical protein AVDCRST_MAG10-1640 [uncultured Acidimicrobiales bacterium]
MSIVRSPCGSLMLRLHGLGWGACGPGGKGAGIWVGRVCRHRWARPASDYVANRRKRRY